MQLYEALSKQVVEWREKGTSHEEYPAIAEILEWARQADVPTFRLREPQLRALETYWYLRLVENTPHIFDLYQKFFPRKKELLEAFGKKFRMNQLDKLLEYVNKDGRICPMPDAWNKLWEMLPDKERVGSGWKPALPLILGAWNFASPFEKHLRLNEHIHYADEHGVLERVDKYLRSLAQNEWYYG